MDLSVKYEPFDRPFRTADATWLGITEHDLRISKRIATIFRGIRSSSIPTPVVWPVPLWADEHWRTLRIRLAAAQLLDPRFVGSFTTAAALYGLPLPNRLVDRTREEPTIHIATSDQNRRLRHPGIVLHRHAELGRRTWLEMDLLEPEDLFLDLAQTLTVDELVALGDALVGGWHGPPLCSPADLADHVARQHLLRSRGTIASALGLIREGVDSPQETWLRLWAVKRCLPEPIVHPRVPCPRIGRVVEPDLGYPGNRLALEYEGDHHRSSVDQWTRDLARDEALRAEGWTVLRVTRRTDMAELEAKIRLILGLPPRQPS